MTRSHSGWPGTAALSLLAAALTWVTLLAWTPFSERPSAYMAPLLGACLLVALTGALLRAARVPFLLVLLGQVLVVGLWLHHRYAGGVWIPTTDSVVTLRATVAAAAQAAQDYAAPVPRGVTEFAPLLVGAGAATAVLVDLLACGLRRAPLAGLPLLAAYTAPVSILDGGVSWLKFAITALLFLVLIAAQESFRLAQWGQNVSAGGDTEAVATSPALWSSARKIGVSATGLAVVVPILVPTLSLELFGDGGGLGGNGESVSLSNPIVDMRRDLLRGKDVDLIRLSTPRGDPSYLRISVLDAFDGSTWRPSSRDIPVEQRASGSLPRPPGLDAETRRREVPWEIEITEEFRSRWLPTPYPASTIEAEGDWRYDRRTLDFISAADGQSTAGLQYRLEALEVLPTAEQLAGAAAAPASVFGPGTELPDDVPDLVNDLAREVTSEADGTFEQAIALQRWFRDEGDFRYSLEREPGNGLDDMTRFLSQGDGGRVGYCEQFAAAMTLMGRSLSIPSRVAVGFLRPEAAGGGTYVYSAHDLHSWPEMYFEGTGWVRFEPTPGIRTGGVPGYTQRERGPDGEPVTPSSTAAPLPNQNNRFSEPSAPTDAAASDTDDSTGGGTDAAGVLALLVGVASLAAAPRLVRSWRRRRRWASATTPAAVAEAAWDELRDTALDLGMAWSDSVTLRRRAVELVRSFGRPGVEDDALGRATERGPDAHPEATAALERLVTRVERARYARSTTAFVDERTSSAQDLAVCVAALGAGASGSQRTRARWLPASLLGQRSGRRRVRRGGSLLDRPDVDHAAV